MDAAHPSNSTQSADTVPMVSPMEMKSLSQNKTKPPELDSPPASKEEHDDIDTTMFLTALHICPLGMALGCLLAHP